jgi:uncharacterized membrane protein
MEPNQPQPPRPPSKDNNRALFAVLGYVLPFLFFLPLINDDLKHDPFSRFHANQQLILLGLIVLASMLPHLFYLLFMFTSLLLMLMQAVQLLILVLIVYGAYNAYKGEMKELPLIGQFRFL